MPRASARGASPGRRAPTSVGPPIGDLLLDSNREFIAPDLRRRLGGQRTPSAAYRLFVHLVFSTRFRFHALTAGAEGRFLGLLQELSQEYGFVVLAARANEEHVHLVL